MAKHRVLFEVNTASGEAATAGSDAGWTVSFYDPTDLTDEACEAKARRLLTALVRCLTKGYQYMAIRISQLDASNNLLRRGRLIQLAGGSAQGQYQGAAAGLDEQPWDAINLSIATVAGARRAFLLRGIGSNVIAASGRYMAPPGFVLCSADLATALRGGGNPEALILLPETPYALRTRSTTGRTNITGVFTTPVANVNLVNDQTRPMIRVPIGTIVAGNQVSITGVLDMPGVNGQWKVTAVQTDPLTANFQYVLLAPRRRVQIKAVYTQGGQAVYWNWTLDPITGFTIGNGASRRTGRPPQQRRGRRSARQS